MAECKPYRRKIQRVCIGALRDIVSIHDRNITPPDFESVDFTLPLPVLYTTRAMVQPRKGARIQDGTNVQRDWTHTIMLRFLPDIDVKDMISFRGQYFAIQEIEESDDHRWLTLYCSVRGTTSNQANYA